MLVIIKEGKYKEYKKTNIKPSEFCKTELKLADVKRTEFVEKYFADIDSLIYSIEEYRRISGIPKGEYSLADILK